MLLGVLPKFDQQQLAHRRKLGDVPELIEQRVAVACGERAGDAAHFPAELEVILKGPHAVGMRESDVGDADEKGDGEDEPGIVEAGWLGVRDGQDAFSLIY